MKEIHYWEAIDGTKFDDENQCEEYERKIFFNSPQAKASGLRVWAQDTTELDLSLCGQAWYYDIPTEEAFKIVADECDWQGTLCPPGIGMWQYWGQHFTDIPYDSYVEWGGAFN